jgi:uncharacterized protein (TIGR04255 family)
MNPTDASVAPGSARRRYRHPPIEEAVCELRFSNNESWDPTIPGLLFAALKDAYPARPTTQSRLEAGINLGAGQENSSSIEFRHDQSRVQLRSSDGRRIVGVGPDGISVHVLRPYTSWEEYKAQIEMALQAYVSVSGPQLFSRVSIRYINRIVLDSPAVDLPTYFTSPPSPPDELPQTLVGFVTRMEAMYDDDQPILLRTTFATTAADENKTAFILDIDVMYDLPSETAATELPALIDDLRRREREAFEALVTDKAREIFDAN